MRTHSSYTITHRETSDWFHMIIERNDYCDDELVNIDIEHVAFSKTARGDIGFTRSHLYKNRVSLLYLARTVFEIKLDFHKC